MKHITWHFNTHELANFANFVTTRNHIADLNENVVFVFIYFTISSDKRSMIYFNGVGIAVEGIHI